MGEQVLLSNSSGYNPGTDVMKARDVKLEPSSHKGVFVGKMIAPVNGFNHAMLSLDLHHMPPGLHTGLHRHDETLLHVLSGSGYSIIDNVRYEWEPGDSIHIKPGVWHQHWNTSSAAANMLACKPTPLLNHIRPFFPSIAKGDDFIAVGDDYIPDHPFGLGRQELLIRSRESTGLDFPDFKQRQAALAERLKNGRTIMKGKDVRWELWSDKGEFNAYLLDPVLGFECRTAIIGMQAIPPGSHNESHVHDEAIVYILRGKGIVLVDDKRIDVEAGDSIFVHFNTWHQFWNLDKSEPFLQIRFTTWGLENYLFPFPYLETDDNIAASDLDPGYVPRTPW